MTFREFRFLLTVGAAYFLTAALSVSTFGTITPIWYCNAITLAAVLRSPPHQWKFLLAVSWLADTAAIGLFGEGPAPFVALCDTLEIMLAATLIQATGGFRGPLFTRWQVPRLVLICMVAPLGSATLAAWAMHTFLQDDFLHAWVTWYSASALGLVIFEPFLLGWSSKEWRERALGYLNRRSICVLAAGGALAAVCATQHQFPELLFVTFPLVVSLAWVYGFMGATVGMASVSLAALAAAWAGPLDVFSVLMPQAGITHRMAAMQIYLAAVLASSMSVAVIRAQQRTLEENLRHASDARTEFLAAMSHEIRTPMTGMLGMADLLAQASLPDKLHHQALALKSSGRHLLSVINDILDFSRIESGTLEFEEIDFALDALGEELRSLMNPAAVERGIGLELALHASTGVVVRGDPTRLRQVLLNLIGNAVKFTEKGGVFIEVTTRLGDTHAQITFEVRDTGVGIDPEKLPALFSPFMQADRSISRKYGGTGLGLAISKRLVEAMGGQIAVESVPGQGSCFRVELTLPTGSAIEHAEAAAPALPLGPQRILVAEDVEVNRHLLQAMLSMAGHELVFAENGAQAVELVQQRAFDMVFMDVQMPVMDGVEATQQIRGLGGAYATIPIIGLTANVMAHERERFLAAGMNDCLGKPIQWERVHAAISRFGNCDCCGPVDEPQEGQDSATADVPLVDEPALKRLLGIISATAVSELLEKGLREYEDTCARMMGEEMTPDEIRRAAHKIKGSSGTLGLARTSALAGRAEQLAEEGASTRELVTRLDAAIRETRDELCRRGELAARTIP